jgi:hypothetical protein
MRDLLLERRLWLLLFFEAVPLDARIGSSPGAAVPPVAALGAQAQLAERRP